MTDQQLAQAVAERLREREAEAKAAGNRRMAATLRRVHAHLDKAWLALQPAMGLAPLSGSPIKPPAQ